VIPAPYKTLLATVRGPVSRRVLVEALHEVFNAIENVLVPASERTGFSWSACVAMPGWAGRVLPRPPTGWRRWGWGGWRWTWARSVPAAVGKAVSVVGGRGEGPALRSGSVDWGCSGPMWRPTGRRPRPPTCWWMGSPWDGGWRAAGNSSGSGYWRPSGPRCWRLCPGGRGDAPSQDRFEEGLTHLRTYVTRHGGGKRRSQVICGRSGRRCWRRCRGGGGCRFDQHSSTGRLPASRSHTNRSCRSCNTATAAHDGHPTRSAVVSTCTCSSPSTSATATATTRNPGNPNVSVAVS